MDSTLYQNAFFISTYLSLLLLYRLFIPNWDMDEFEETVLMEASALAIVLVTLDFKSIVLRHESTDTEIRTLADSSVINEITHFSSLFFDIFDLFVSYFKIEFAFKKFDVFVLHNFEWKTISSFGVIYMR